MDERLTIIKQKKQQEKAKLMEKSAMEAKDLKSGILLRDNSRVMTEEEIL